MNMNFDGKYFDFLKLWFVYTLDWQLLSAVIDVPLLYYCIVPALFLTELRVMSKAKRRGIIDDRRIIVLNRFSDRMEATWMITATYAIMVFPIACVMHIMGVAKYAVPLTWLLYGLAFIATDGRFVVFTKYPEGRS
jgi:hypothetical protein